MKKVLLDNSIKADNSKAVKELQRENKRNQYKYDYFGGVIYPRLKNHAFDQSDLQIKIPTIASMKSIFLSRGGHHTMVQVFYKKLHIADIGIRFLNPEARRVITKSIFIRPIGSIKSLLEDIKKTGKRVKLIHRVDANPNKKIFIRAQAVPKITESLMKESRKWLISCAEFLNY